MREKQKMLAGELYRVDAELLADMQRAQEIVAEYNKAGGDKVLSRKLLEELLGSIGADVVIKPSFRCDYGYNISIGARSFINYDCVLLDCNKIVIGAEVQIAPGVHIYTATHPLDAATRRVGLESAHPVTISDGVWLCGRVVICPGVTIGENTVVGAASVVTEDLPANVVAMGVPARPVCSV